MKTLILLGWLLVFPVLATPVSDLTLVGEGKMRWLFWELYQARFYSQDGEYRPGDYPQALELRYARNIDRDDLLEATVVEWERLGIDWKPEWPRQLARIWPSVSRRDELVLRVDDNGISRFYFNWQLLGEMTDPEFGPAFLEIWMSSNSRDPALTRQLKGS
ncbi:chalcone isomerase family protein [Zobellella maritima]|uniref:hypothetical protein n=1 Tax=Zobellella maritima TaxID=2059725 RepID=UPI000E30A1EF|nr:hypothetical protein [Zobellella maritima]